MISLKEHRRYIISKSYQLVEFQARQLKIIYSAWTCKSDNSNIPRIHNFVQVTDFITISKNKDSVYNISVVHQSVNQE